MSETYRGTPPPSNKRCTITLARRKIEFLYRTKGLYYIYFWSITIVSFANITSTLGRIQHRVAVDGVFAPREPFTTADKRPEQHVIVVNGLGNVRVNTRGTATAGFGPQRSRSSLFMRIVCRTRAREKIESQR